MHTIERELIKASGYKARQKYADRQDYLKSILNAVIKLTDDDFNSLSDEAAVWTNAAIEAVNSKTEELPDFDEAAAEDEEPEEDHDPETGEVIEDEEADAEGTENDEAEDAEEVSDDEDELPHDVDTDEDEAAEEAEKPKRKPAKTSRKSPPAPVKKLAKDHKPEKVSKKVPPAHRGEDVVLDKWGAMEGSKNSQALALFEKGATTKEVKDTLGGTYYNILKRAVEAGHKIDKEGSLIKLTHKDEAGKKTIPKGAPKPVVKKGKK